jgi:hypothetical protein
MLHEFAGTPYEGEEGIHEESRGHCAFHGVLCLLLTTPRPLVSTTLRRSRRRAVGRGRADLVWTTPRLRRGRAVPSRREQRGREEHPSQREAPLREHLGAPSMGFETPNEEWMLPRVKPGGLVPRRQSLSELGRGRLQLRG